MVAPNHRLTDAFAAVDAQKGQSPELESLRQQLSKAELERDQANQKTDALREESERQYRQIQEFATEQMKTTAQLKNRDKEVDRLRDDSRRFLAGAIAASIVALGSLIIAGAGWYGYEQEKGNHQKTRAKADREHAEKDAALSDLALGFRALREKYEQQILRKDPPTEQDRPASVSEPDRR